MGLKGITGRFGDVKRIKGGFWVGRKEGCRKGELVHTYLKMTEVAGRELVSVSVCIA